MIWAFTLLLGWTGFGWLLALIWAFKAPRRSQEIGFSKLAPVRYR